jgi:RimJ/RimL family protein N-acetyltransferase
MTPADLDAMALLLGDPEVMAYYSHAKSRDEALEWIEWNQSLYRQRGFGLWIIERLADADLAGDCGLTPQQVDGVVEIELGYHVRRALQGRGYATEAAAACRDYARDTLNVRRLIALIDPANRASQRVAAKVGMTFERETIRESGKVLQVFAAAL